MTRRPLGAVRDAGPQGWRWAGVASGALHGLALVAVMWRPSLASAPPDRAALEVEFVSQPATVKGAPAGSRPPAPPGHATAVPSLAPAVEPVPTAPGRAAAVASPPPTPAVEPVPAAPGQAVAASPPPPPAPANETLPAAPASPAAAPAVNLGDADDDRDALTVTGDVVSPGPDPRYRNKPPGYPRAALLLHEQGTVQVLIHVAPDGSAERVELVASSGSAALDEAGLAAVAKWHFAPALRDGMPVASVYPLSMNFRGHE